MTKKIVKVAIYMAFLMLLFAINFILVTGMLNDPKCDAEWGSLHPPCNGTEPFCFIQPAMSFDEQDEIWAVECGILYAWDGTEHECQVAGQLIESECSVRCEQGKILSLGDGDSCDGGVCCGGSCRSPSDCYECVASKWVSKFDSDNCETCENNKIVKTTGNNCNQDKGTCCAGTCNLKNECKTCDTTGNWIDTPNALCDNGNGQCCTGGECLPIMGCELCIDLGGGTWANQFLPADVTCTDEDGNGNCCAGTCEHLTGCDFCDKSSDPIGTVEIGADNEPCTDSGGYAGSCCGGSCEKMSDCEECDSGEIEDKDDGGSCGSGYCCGGYCLQSPSVCDGDDDCAPFKTARGLQKTCVEEVSSAVNACEKECAITCTNGDAYETPCTDKYGEEYVPSCDETDHTRHYYVCGIDGTCEEAADPTYDYLCDCVLDPSVCGPYTCCGEEEGCVHLDNNDANCGSCGITCETGICANGVCQCSNPNEDMCEVTSDGFGGCTDTSSDSEFCGMDCCKDVSSGGLSTCTDCTTSGMICLSGGCALPASSSSFKSASFSIYQARKESDSLGNTVAYQFLPSGQKFISPVDFFLKYRGEEFNADNNINVYRYEDDQMEVKIIRSASKEIGFEGGTISIGNVILTIPPSTLFKTTPIIINEVYIVNELTEFVNSESNEAENYLIDEQYQQQDKMNDWGMQEPEGMQDEMNEYMDDYGMPDESQMQDESQSYNEGFFGTEGYAFQSKERMKQLFSQTKTKSALTLTVIIIALILGVYFSFSIIKNHK